MCEIKKWKELKKFINLNKGESYCWHSSILIFEPPNNYFICLLYDCENSEILLNNSKNKKVVSLDKGGRTVIVAFDGKKFIEYGGKSFHGDDNLLSKLIKLNKLKVSYQSAHDECSPRVKMQLLINEGNYYEHGSFVNSHRNLVDHVGKKWKKKRYIFNKKMKIIERRKKHLVSEFQNKTINELVKENDIILSPKFHTVDMVKKEDDQGHKRKIGKKVAKGLLDLNFFQFQKKLLNKSEKAGKIVIEEGEHYTSKSNFCCLEINRKLGGKKKCECKNCKIHNDNVNWDFLTNKK